MSDESFLTQTQLKEIDGGQGGKPKLVSAESGHPVEWVEEQNYMFRLSSFRDDLIHWLKQNGKIWFHTIVLYGRWRVAVATCNFLNVRSVYSNLHSLSSNCQVYMALPLPGFVLQFGISIIF